MDTIAAEENWIKSLADLHREAAGPNASPYEPTGTLIAILSSIHRGRAMWSWLGPLESRREGVPLEISIAQHLGLQPTEREFGPDILQPVTADEAKSLLAYLVLGGLGVMPGGGLHPRPSQALLDALDVGFEPFGSKVQCFSNGDYHLAAKARPQTRGHTPLTGATVDTGVICHDGSVGFAFWVDWEY